MTTTKFALRNYLGQPTTFFLVEEHALSVDQKAAAVPTISDLIIVLDASGSMYGDMAEMRQMIAKVLSVTEFRAAHLRISLVSYSSYGDCIVHFERVPVVEVMAAGSKHEAQIRSLSVRGLTCISQGLLAGRQIAEKAARDGGTVAITLMSDGWANDRAPTAERREIERIIAEFSASSVFCSTIAFRESSDFQLLASIANSLSGSCIQARDVRQVHDTIYDTAKLLAGKTTPAITLALDGASYQTFVSRSQKKILGAAGDLLVRGLSDTDDRTVYTYQEVTESKFSKTKCAEARPTAIYAFARAMISEGRINRAKYALVASRNETLLEEHAKALTGEQIAALAADLDNMIFQGVPTDHRITTKYGLSNAKAPSVLDVCRLLNTHVGSFEVDAAKLVAGYRRRGLKKLVGTRGDDGRLKPPAYRTVYKDRGPFAHVGGFEINRNTATINMMVTRPVVLARAADGATIDEVKGVKLNQLTDFKQYTIVGDGALNVDVISIRISDKRTWRALEDAGLVKGEYDPEAAYPIRFAGRPLVAYTTTFDVGGLITLPEQILKLRALSSLLGALLKDTSARFTEAQVAALTEYGLSANLYVNLPTTIPYTDITQAVARGEVDYRVSYKVNLGTVDSLDAAPGHSANAFLARWYACTGVEDAKSPKLIEWWKKGFHATEKDHSKLKTITSSDKVLAAIFDDFFRGGEHGEIHAIATSAKIDLAVSAKALRAFKQVSSSDEAVEALTAFRRHVDKALDRIYEESVSPLAFFVGASGLIPDDFGEVPALTAEQFTQRFPSAALSKAEREATFYVLADGLVLSVYAKSEPYSTPKGVEAARLEQNTAGVDAAA